MSTVRKHYWIVAAILVLTIALSAAPGATQKSESPEVLYQRAIQKEQVDGDRKTAIEFYTQVVAAPGATSATKVKAQARLSSLTAPTVLVDRQVCIDCGGAQLPASISVDGRYLAFSGSEGLSVREIASGVVTTFLSESAFAPAISPDKKHIAYLGRAKPGTTWALGIDLFDLRIIANEKGAKPRILINDPEYLAVTPAAWAPDGKSILAVVTKREDQTDQTAPMLAWVSTSDGSVRKLISLGRRFSCCGVLGFPSVSPDGRYVAYAARVSEIPARSVSPASVPSPDSNDVHIYVIPADGSTDPIELVKGASINEGPVWMPDGKSLLFVSNRGGSFGLWSAAVKDGSLTPVRLETGEIRPLGVSASGTYFYSRRVGRIGSSFDISELQGAAAQAGTPKVLETIQGSFSAWSPDGKFVAYTRSLDINPIGQGNGFASTLFVYDLATKNQNRYPPSAAISPSGTLRWFRDGKSLLQPMQDSNGNRSLYRVDLKTHAFKLLASKIQSGTWAISSDDKTVYVIEPGEAAAVPACRTDRILAVDTDSGQQKRLATVPQPEGMIVSPDERTLYFTICDHTLSSSDLGVTYNDTEQVDRRVVALDIATGQLRDVFVVEKPKGIGDLSLSPDGRTFAAVILENSTTYWQQAVTRDGLDKNERLIRFGVDGAELRELHVLPVGYINNPSWTRDGSAILFTPGNGSKGRIRISANGGDPEVIPSASTSSINLVVSPDGTHAIVWPIVGPLAADSIRQETWALENVSSSLKTTR